MLREKNLVSYQEPMHATQVGWKFSRQREMAAKGLPIPPFFCLTSSFYLDIFQSLKDEIEEIIRRINFANPAAIKKGSQEIQKCFYELRFSSKQKKWIYSFFDQHFTVDDLVSVRSSTVGFRLEDSEDSKDNPFAGMSDSFLYVKREQLLEKIKGCWASGFSPEGMIYRHQQQIDLLGFGVAVGVQKMIFGQRSFVMFTYNPNTAAQETVVVSGYGIGEGIVQERVPVDHYFLNHKSGELKSEIVIKNLSLTFDDQAGYGLCKREIEPSLAKKPILTKAEIHQLSQIGEKIEGIFQAPQDIEGTITKNGDIYILQTRPIAFDFRRQRVWTNTNVTESFPGVTTALTYSFSKYFYRVIFADCYLKLGVKPRTLQNNFDMLDRMIGWVRGRVYYNLTAFYQLHSQSPIFPLVQKSWEDMMGFLASYQTKDDSKAENFFSRVRDKGKFYWAMTRLGYLYLGHQRAMKEFHQWWEELIGPLRGESFEQQDPLVLESEFYRVWHQVGNHWGITLINDTYLPLVYSRVENLFQKWKLADNPALLSDLLCGEEDIMSVKIVLSAVSLAEQVRKSSELSQLFQKGEKEIWAMIEKGEIDPTFCDAVREHLHRYGDRGLQELKVEQPNLRHTPWVFIKMIQNYIKSNMTVEKLIVQEEKVRAAAEKELKKRLKGHSIRYWVIKKMLNALRRLIRNRENSRYCRSELYGFSKNIFYALGRHFAARGILLTETDLMHLTLDEIFGYIDGTGVLEDLQSVAAQRKDEFTANESVETPVSLTTLGPFRENVLTVDLEKSSGSDMLTGIGSSSGKVRGIARVVKDPNSHIDVGENMILIARETDPGWIFLMLASKGMVVERGSMLSHTAITGRKFGIPTVVSVRNATRRIPDGAEIEIDGAQGTVKIIR